MAWGCDFAPLHDFELPEPKDRDTLLAIEPKDRGMAASALQSDPLACDPSSLPKFPPSKEYDAKIRDEEARRRREAALKGPGTELGQRTTRDPKANPAQTGMENQACVDSPWS